MSSSNSVQRPEPPLPDLLPVVPERHNDPSLWCDYRVNWQKYSQSCSESSKVEIKDWISLREAQRAYCQILKNYHDIRDIDFLEVPGEYCKARGEYYKAQAVYDEFKRDKAKKDFDEAKRKYDAALDTYRRKAQDMHFRAQEERDKAKKDFDEAKRKYDEALDTNSKAELAHFNARLNCDIAQWEYDKAKREYQLAMEEITPWKFFADAYDACLEAAQASKKYQPGEEIKNKVDKWLGYFFAWLDYRQAWCKHWAACGQPWRTEPEIDRNRQKELDDRRKDIKPNIEEGIYPFKGIKWKLTRADIEWLLAPLDSPNQYSPVNWDDETQRERKGLDLRGANLRDIDLSRLPLTCMLGGLSESERGNDKHEGWGRCRKAAVRLEGSSLFEAHLESAQLQFAHLERADLDTTHLEGAKLFRANLKGAKLRYAYFDRTTNLDSVTLDGAYVADARWEDVNLSLVAWERVEKLGDELKAEECEKNIPKKKSLREARNEWITTYRRAIKANRQVATVLRVQGLDEKADDFDYQAQILQRKLLYRQGLWRRRGLWAPKPTRRQSVGMIVSSRVSWLLAFVAGYGYRPWRWVGISLLVLGVFALLLLLIEQQNLIKVIEMQHQHATWLNLSLIALFTSLRTLIEHHIEIPLDGLNLIESFFGWIIEAVLIAIIVKRIMGKSGG